VNNGDAAYTGLHCTAVNDNFGNCQDANHNRHAIVNCYISDLSCACSFRQCSGAGLKGAHVRGGAFVLGAECLEEEGVVLGADDLPSI